MTSPVGGAAYWAELAVRVLVAVLAYLAGHKIGKGKKRKGSGPRKP